LKKNASLDDVLSLTLEDMLERRLETVDWSRSNAKLWEGRAMHAGRINASRNNVILTTIVLKRALGLELTMEDNDLEQRLSLSSQGKK